MRRPVIVVDEAAHRAMLDHMQQAAPSEGCGLLAGPVVGVPPRIPCPRDTDGDGDCGRPLCPHCHDRKLPGMVCDTWVPMANVAEFPRVRFEMDPEALVEAWQRLETAGRRPWIVCHSHVRDVAVPSVRDVLLAVDGTLRHLVVSLAGPFPTASLWHLSPFSLDPAVRMRKIHYQVTDLGFHGNPATDLTHDVSGD